jgi:hypothetical protein
VNARVPAGDSRTSLGGRRRGQSFAQRLASTYELLGYGEEDEALVRATREAVLAQSDAIAGALYAHLLSHRETAVYFMRADGRVDREAVEARHASLQEWLAVAIEAPLDEKLAAYLAEVGRAHTGRERGAKARVQARFLVVAMSFLHAELIGILGEAIADRAVLLASMAAWNKLLMVHLDLFLAVYASAEGTAHWY